jgi:hypothetical protein
MGTSHRTRPLFVDVSKAASDLALTRMLDAPDVRFEPETHRLSAALVRPNGANARGTSWDTLLHRCV